MPDPTPKKRDHHGPNRNGVPPPPSFDLAALADGTLLTEAEAAAILRLTLHTLTAWRLRDDQRRDDRLAWIRLPNGHVRYTAAAIRAYLALGPRKKKQRKPAPSPKRPTAPRRRAARVRVARVVDRGAQAAAGATAE